MQQKPQYRAPRFAEFKKDRSYFQISRQAEEAVANIYADPNLSEMGKAKAAAKALAPFYKQLRGIKTALKRREPELALEMERITGRAFSVTADVMRREQMAELLREGRRDPAFRKQFMERVLDGSDNSPRTVELRKYILNSDPMLTGFSDASMNLLRLRLQPSLPAEVGAVERKFALLREEVEDTQHAMNAIQQAVHREHFEELGVVGKPMNQWTPDERADYVATHGMDAFTADLYADMEFSRGIRGEVPTGSQPEGHAGELENEANDARKRTTGDTHLGSLFERTDATAA